MALARLTAGDGPCRTDEVTTCIIPRVVGLGSRLAFLIVVLSGCGGGAPPSSGSSTVSSTSTSTLASTGETVTGAGGGAPLPVCAGPVSAQHLSTQAHDPSMIRGPGGAHYLFSTGGTLRVRASADLATWSDAGHVFPAVPPWIAASLGTKVSELWAPDVSLLDGRYHLYYAGSTFGSNRSVIGLATNATLDPGAPGYAWVDEGLVIRSNAPGTSDDWNAIDPNLALDEAGEPWLVFGSWWSGIKLRRIDRATGKPSAKDPVLYALAARNASAGTRAIEAASLVRHGGYHYLFVSFDLCCRGANSTYRTMVGRASRITGPYTDKAGRPMVEGWAEELLATEGRYLGPGGGTAFEEDGCHYYMYHYYDGQAAGAPTLSMRPIRFDEGDWPVLGDPLWP